MITAIYFSIVQYIVVLPWYIYHKIIVLYGLAFKGFSKSLKPLDCLLAETPTNMTTLSILQMKRKITLDEIKKHFTRSVLNATLDNTKTIRYPELKQKVVQYKGCWFFEQDKNFNIDHHIYEQSDKVKFQNLDAIHEHFLHWTPDFTKSPWELILIQNDPQETGCTIALRIHHCVADFKSVSKLVVEGLGEKPIKAAKPKTAAKSQSVLDRVLACITYPLDVVQANRLFMSAYSKAKRQPWFCTPNILSLPGKTMSVAITENIPLSDVRAIAKQNDVCGSAVIYSIIAAALTKLQGKCWPQSEVSKIPLFFTVAKPNHPSTLTNHV